LPVNKKEKFKLRNGSPRTNYFLKESKKELKSGDKEGGKE
jgi:hypothetical protein